MSEVLDAPREQSLAREYVALRVQLEAVFRDRFPSLRGLEGDLYNEAWESLLRRETPPDSTFAYLERALYNRGLNELRRRARRPGDSPDAAGTEKLDDVLDRTAAQTEESVVGDLAAAATNQVLLDRLTARQARILKLRHQWDLSAREIAAAIGASQKTVRRELEEAAAVVGENVTWVEPCRGRGRRSLMRAYVLGILSERRAAKALAHLDACPSCRALREQMEEALRGAAAVVPVGLVKEPPPLPRSLLDRIVQAADGAREQLGDLAGAAKQQAAAVVGRAPAGDAATQVAAGGGLRGSGAMLATAASCLVVGGGTVTYCAVEGVPDPVRSVIPGLEKADGDKPEKQPDAAGEHVEAPADPEPPPLAEAPAPEPYAREPVLRQSAPQPPPPPPAEEEFGIEQSAPAPSASTADTTSSPSGPATAPSGGGTEEFGFER